MDREWVHSMEATLEALRAERDALKARVAELQTDLCKLTDPSVIHANILSGLFPLTRAQALHIAGATNYDALAKANGVMEAALEKSKKYLEAVETWAECCPESPNDHEDSCECVRTLMAIDNALAEARSKLAGKEIAATLLQQRLDTVDERVRVVKDTKTRGAGKETEE